MTSNELILPFLRCLHSSYHVPYIYLTDWAKTQGQPKDEESLEEFLYNVPSGRQSEEPSFLLSIVGILNTLGVVRIKLQIHRFINYLFVK